MKNSKLIYFLGLLPAQERKAFRTYISTPFFNERDGLKRLLDVLEKEILLCSGNLTKEELYRSVYGDKPYNESSLKTSMTQLLGLLREFLAFQKYREKRHVQRQFFLEKLNDLNESRFFGTYFYQAQKKLAQADLPQDDRFTHEMLLEEAFHHFRARQPGRDPGDHLRNAVEALGNGFLIRMLRYHLSAVERLSTFQEAHRTDLMLMAMAYLEENLHLLPPVVRVYYQLYRAASHPEELSLYTEAQKMLVQWAGQFSQKEALELYTVALNCAARQLNEGKLEFLPLIFDLFVQMLDQEIIISKGKISPWYYKNIINVALRLQKTSWAEEFIDAWQDKVYPDYAQNAQNFNRGMLHYYRKEFGEAEACFYRLLQDYQDMFYGLNARGYLLQIYYETENIRGMESLMHSFRMYLDRNVEISDVKRRQYIAFINHLRKLVNIPLQDYDRLQKLYEEIESKDRKGMGSDWLLSKIGKLVAG